MDSEMQSITLGDGSQSFRTATFDSAAPKMGYLSRADLDAGKQREQEKNKDGLPKWAVRLNVMPYGADRGDYITVSVASEVNPAEVFHYGDAVKFQNIRVGANGYRERAGFSWFYFADAIVPANELAAAK